MHALMAAVLLGMTWLDPPDLALLPWDDTFSLASEESVTHVSGMKCYPSLGKGRVPGDVY